MPAYPPDDADLRTFRLAGLELPVRSTVVVVATILLVIFDFQRTLIPHELLRYDRNPGEQRLQAYSRLFLYLVVPLAIVVLGFRDRPSRYGLRLGDWRWGLGLALVGCAVMTPIILLLATLPDFRAYYTPSDEPVPGLLVTNILDLFSTEFIFRGFLMLALARYFGPDCARHRALPVHVRAPDEARDGAPLDVRRRRDLRLVRVADGLDPVGRGGARVHRHAADRRVGRPALGTAQGRAISRGAGARAARRRGARGPGRPRRASPGRGSRRSRSRPRSGRRPAAGS